MQASLLRRAQEFDSGPTQRYVCPVSPNLLSPMSESGPPRTPFLGGLAPGKQAWWWQRETCKTEFPLPVGRRTSGLGWLQMTEFVRNPAAYVRTFFPFSPYV